MGHRAEVWAPRATRVELLTRGQSIDMEPLSDGWYGAPLVLPPNADYGFALDGSDPLPDPRSHWQPAGVAGPSRVVDHDSFEWSDRSWTGVHLPASIIYELHVGTFGARGTFDGVSAHLNHLVALGVGIIQVMPVTAFGDGHGWGYEGGAPYAVHEGYGGPEGFKRFVDAAHARGIGVVLDVAYNHLGSAADVLGQFGPYTTDREISGGDAVNLDGPDGVQVRRYFVDNARHWLTNYHLDGLRLDAPEAFVDESDQHFLRELAEETEALAAHLGRPLWLLAAHPTSEPAVVSSREIGGHGFHAVSRDEVHHELHGWLVGERDGHDTDVGRVTTLAEALIGPRRNLPRSRFVVCAQNHDHIGMRAGGDRLCHLVDLGLAKAAAALIICSPFVPLLFMGEEWAASSPFPDFNGDDPIAIAAFESARLRWHEVDDGEHREMFAWYRALVALRRSRPELSDPRPQSTAVDEHETEHAIVLWRGSTAIAVNIDESPVALVLDPVPGRRVLLASDDAVELNDDGVVLPPHSVAIIG